MNELEQAMEVCELRIYRVYITILKEEFRSGTPYKGDSQDTVDTRVLSENALFDDVRSLFMQHTGISLDVGDVMNLASTGSLARTMPKGSYGVIFAEAVEQPKTFGCGEDFAGWDVITMIASYWHHRAWDNPDRYDADCLRRAMFLDKLAVKEQDEQRVAIQNDDYLRMYHQWRDSDYDERAIFEILKGCGQYV